MVYIDNRRVEKPGTKVDVMKDIKLKGNSIPYVGRGGLKLEKAINEFSLTVENKVAIDIGASTGGFTDCMLQNGAKKVYAIDVGYGQLAWKLRKDERVIPIERTNIRYATKDTTGELADFISIDVSFISLRLVLPVAKELSNENADIIALIKPQFEAGREKVGKKGIVRDINVHREVIYSINEFCSSIDLSIKDLTYSPIRGTGGNIEYLTHIVKNDVKNNDIENLIEKVVAQSHKEL
ncbi:TlyA family RNA methyltransferase [Caldisalinibacter kiritimatiensis]|uniref:RNA binding methyltransferase, FtsJ n=1 Tax=Caldisalinibacter kiritimatiensis TaxID=1304284 RepID=R1ASH7_9FIRM|nr:TlyA family RNA methyltransferase [Caldisalinibacter kiritimatiensis]EOC99611.1 RNA binding methyltransferase, FtsJ [Caldisalinibacter kiritimatiensis]